MSVFIKALLFPLQKSDTTEEVEIVEPPKPEKKKTRKGKKGGASPEDEEGEEGEAQLNDERNGEQRDNKKVNKVFFTYETTFVPPEPPY